MGAVLITGLNGVEKKQFKSILELQNPDKSESYLQLADIEPSKLLEGENLVYTRKDGVKEIPIGCLK